MNEGYFMKDRTGPSNADIDDEIYYNASFTEGDLDHDQEHMKGEWFLIFSDDSPIQALVHLEPEKLDQ